MSSLTDQPATVLLANSLPKRPPVFQLRFRFRDDTVRVTKGLFELFTFGDRPPAVAFVEHKGIYYITRSNHPDAWRIRTSVDDKFGVVEALINSKPLCTHFRTLWQLAPASSAVLPIATFAVSAAEIGLDPTAHPYPLYRFITDQLTTK